MPDSSDNAVEEASSTEDAEQLGERLKSARKAQDLSLENVAAELRIDANVLDALERGSFGELGAPVFIRGYIKQYGRALGLDVDALLASFEAEANAQEVVVRPRKSIHLRDERQITHWIVAALVVALVVVLLFLWWTSPLDVPAAGLFRDTADDAPPESQLSEPLPEPIPRAVFGRAEEPREEEAGLSGVADDSTDSIETAAVPGAVALQETPRGPRDAAGEPRPSAARVENAAAPAEAPLAALSLEFRDDSWAEITDARDVQLYYDLGRAGETATVYGEPPFNLFFGNADGVQVVFAGEDVAIPPGARRGNLANFIIRAPRD